MSRKRVAEDDVEAGDEAPPRRRRRNKFVPLDEVPEPGLSPRARELLALAMSGLALYLLLSLATFRLGDDAGIPTSGLDNLGGAVGYWLAFGFVVPLGFAGWVPGIVLLVYGVVLFIGRTAEKPILKAVGALAFAMMLAILLAGRDGQSGFCDLAPFSAGGIFGATVSPSLESAFGGSGRLLLVGFGLLVSLLLVTEWLLSQMLIRGLALGEELWRRVRRHWRPAMAAAEGGIALADEALDESPDESGTEPAPRRRRRAARRTASAGEAEDAPAAASAAAATDPAADSDAETETEAEAEAEVETAAAAAGESDAGSAADAAAAGEVDGDGEAAEADAAEEAAPADPPAAKKRPPMKIRIGGKSGKKRAAMRRKRKASQSTLPFDEAYPFPPFELFREPEHDDISETAEALARGGESIVSKLANFKIEAEVVAASVGPAVTQYELRLAEHIRVNKVASFESDLAAALRAMSVRIVAPIPGKDTVGVEVPNQERQKVYMRDLLDQFGRSEDLGIPLFLGKDVAGNPIVEDLARMPHLLIAGTTGSGKSVCINAILLSILVTRTPAQVKLILVDPKMVELQAYKRVPHLCCDVVTNMKKAPAVLQWAVDEMENRYAILSAAGVNHIRSYNRLGQQEIEKRLGKAVEPDRIRLPYIVIVIDEFADLMNVAQNEVEDSIQRLAQKSRAVGMHVILATQRPSSEVITGIIKANLPCQIAFRVNRRIDSRVILDSNGAEKLLGHGDMLYMPPGGGALLRAQGAFVSDEELGAVIRHLEERGQEPQFNRDLVQTQSSSRPSAAKSDELYNEAVEVILGQQRGSATLLQRALSVGYTRATRLLELMEQDGLVGPFVGSKSREVMLTLDEWKQREEAIADELAALEDGEEFDGDAAEFEADEVDAELDDADEDAEDEDAEDGDAEDGDAEDEDVEEEGAEDDADEEADGEDEGDADEDGEDEGEDEGDDDEEDDARSA